ncbi:uncharacterized protein [Garra rufa]|uniref:uncharacterized protein n=1 Tax=Garra rufa TaxID=137080 RepID=UPI003CCED1ED
MKDDVHSVVLDQHDSAALRAQLQSAQLPVLVSAAGAKEVNKKMLRLLILFLILRGAAASSDDQDFNSSGDDIGDDEDGEDVVKQRRPELTIPEDSPGADPDSDKSTGDGDNGGGTLVIIIAAVSVAVLAIGSIVAIVLFRRYLRSREQGVYSVPAEQGQKAAV